MHGVGGGANGWQVVAHATRKANNVERLLAVLGKKSQHATDGVAVANVEVAVLAQVIGDVVSCALSNRLVNSRAVQGSGYHKSILEAKAVNKELFCGNALAIVLSEAELNNALSASLFKQTNNFCTRNAHDLSNLSLGVIFHVVIPCSLGG